MTVGEFKSLLSRFDDNDELIFDGGLTVSNLELWGDDQALVHFQQLQAELTPQTKRLIQVAFCTAPELDGDVEVVSVPRI